MTPQAITIRPQEDRDQADLKRLEAVEESHPLAAPVLVAEANGTLIAAVSIPDGCSIADPFRRSLEAVELLQLRVSQLPRRRRERRLRRPRRARAALGGSPPGGGGRLLDLS